MTSENAQNWIQGKTCLITGGNSGIGKETALALAQEGAQVILVCRNQQKGEEAQKEIKKLTGNPQVDLLLADLGSMKQVRQLANTVLNQYTQLHLLINNAGLLLGKRHQTDEGHETTFAVNHLGHFLLTLLLLERIKASAPARIINVSSMVHRGGTIEFDNLMGEKSYRSLRAYSQSKLANILFTYSLAEKLIGTEVTVNCLHPGIVSTNFGNKGAKWYLFFKAIAKPLIYISPQKGAETLIYLSTSSEVEKVSGKYFVRKKAIPSSSASYNQKLQSQLWEVSEQLTGIKYS